jgi:hypothetical protein
MRENEANVPESRKRTGKEQASDCPRRVLGHLSEYSGNVWYEIATAIRRGAGVAIPVILPFPFLSATLAGKFSHDVFTTRPVQLFDFVGEAEFTQASSIGPKPLGPNHLKILSQSFLNKHAHITSGSIPVPSGTTVGLSIFSQTLGVLALHSEGPAS